jgi:hypothetical protein
MAKEERIKALLLIANGDVKAAMASALMAGDRCLKRAQKPAIENIELIISKYNFFRFA